MDYLAVLLAGVEGLRPRLPVISEAADQVAGRLAADGRLLLASARPDFTSEGFIRSGGLMLAEEWTPETALSANDAVILGWSGASPDQELELLGELRASGALIVGIGPASWAGADSQLGADLFLESEIPLSEVVTAPFGGEGYPLISLQNLVVLWTFTGEIVAALTRIGRMPAMYQSVLVAGARDRNARFVGSRFHPTHQVPALPPGQVGGEYLNEIGGILRVLIEEEAEAIERVCAVCAEVLNDGRVIHAGMISHFPVYQHGAPGDPLYMRRLARLDGESPSVAELERELESGDLFFFLGYYRRPTQAYLVARRAGARIVEVITGDGLDGPPQPDYFIRPKWPFGDAVTRVPGYDVEILPSSGIVQTAIYWAVVAAIWQELSRQDRAERAASTRIL
ncbi:MAG: hypothetical protein OXM01_15595 [Gemmatimonadota bacterium]|nr:hypothetical protein [Gemmatimonadota bacterium]